MKATKRKPSKGSVDQLCVFVHSVNQCLNLVWIALFNSVIYSDCAEAPVLLEDLDFAAALCGSSSDTGVKKKKTTVKASPSQSELTAYFYLVV